MWGGVSGADKAGPMTKNQGDYATPAVTAPQIAKESANASTEAQSAPAEPISEPTAPALVVPPSESGLEGPIAVPETPSDAAARPSCAPIEPEAGLGRPAVGLSLPATAVAGPATAPETLARKSMKKRKQEALEAVDEIVAVNSRPRVMADARATADDGAIAESQKRLLVELDKVPTGPVAAVLETAASSSPTTRNNIAGYLEASAPSAAVTSQRAADILGVSRTRAAAAEAAAAASEARGRAAAAAAELATVAAHAPVMPLQMPPDAARAATVRSDVICTDTSAKTSENGTSSPPQHSDEPSH